MKATSPTPAATAPADAPHPAQALDDAVHEQLSHLAMGLSPISLALACADWAMHLAVSPGRQMQLAQRALELTQQAWSQPWQAALGDEGQPQTDKDARFSDPAWNQWPFNTLKDHFKASDVWWREATQVDGVSRHHHHMVDFFARQWLDALSPSNWASTNPQVLQHGAETLGQSWLKGYQRFLQDLQHAQQRRNSAGTDTLEPLPFAVGKDVAVTPGKVVFRNDLIELIQYAPTTAQVYTEPLLIVPSTIMKYYILDLSPHNSMVKYLVAQGFTVFMISWRNPEARDRNLGMDDYLQSGVMAAMSAVKSTTRQSRIHAMGYCLGGTFLAIVASLLGLREHAAQSKSRKQPTFALALDALPDLASITLLAAQTDFTEPGELGVFIDDDQLKTLREEMARTGYLSGRQMAGSFQFLNARDLIWSRNTQRYLLGQDDTGNDMMSWNADTTRLPERMHNEYLNTLFLNNALVEGHYRVAGQSVALVDIHAPLMAVGTLRDHVSPWRSVYKIHLATDTDTTFILAAGGHNAGIVSEPGHPNRSYQMDHMANDHDWVDPDEWVAHAPRYDGSWWQAWNGWLRQHSSGKVKARTIAAKQALCDAPGTYVMTRYAD